jgi:hypothetical protein
MITKERHPMFAFYSNDDLINVSFRPKRRNPVVMNYKHYSKKISPLRSGRQNGRNCEFFMKQSHFWFSKEESNYFFNNL